MTRSARPIPERGLRPPMGWNSWDCVGTTVTEGEVLVNATFMRDHMLPHGCDTVVMDIQWYEPTARAHGYNPDAPLPLDDHGRQLPAPDRFPSAADGTGSGPPADRVHQLGLRFGLHIMRGVPRRAVAARLPAAGTGWTADEIADTGSVCTWNSDNYDLNHGHPGAQAYYDSQVAQFSLWGVDFIRADDMLFPYHEREISACARATARSGRPIELSLCPGNDVSLAHLDRLRDTATNWRVCDDLWAGGRTWRPSSPVWSGVPRTGVSVVGWTPTCCPSAMSASGARTASAPSAVPSRSAC